MLAIIHNDHINMNRLLKLLRKKIELLNKDEKIDYHLTKSIITYLRTYSDKYHHPLEDFIYDYYVKHYDQSAEVGTRLPEEHKHLKKVTIELDELLNMILLDAIVPKEQCIEKLQYFVDLQSAHMAYEEQELLPLIENSLTPDDWLNIEQQWRHNGYRDPLFGKNIADQYQKLAAVINRV
jgi:hemerythrin-like domain-containing protein